MLKMSAEQVADLLNCDVRTLRNWEALGTGPKKVMENRKPVYPIKSLKAWLRVHRPDVQLEKPTLTSAQREEERRARERSEKVDQFFADYYPDGYPPPVEGQK